MNTPNKPRVPARPDKGRELDTRRKPAPARAPNKGRNIGLDVPDNWALEALRIDFAAAAQRRRKWFLIRLSLFVGLPTLVAALYVSAYVTPRYVSEFEILYQSFGHSVASPAAGLFSSLLGSASESVDMPRVIESYLTSDTMLHVLDRQLDLRSHYSNPSVDWLNRLPPAASDDVFLSYFRKRVTADVMMGGYLVVSVEAYDPQYAARIGQGIVTNVDRMVEDLSERAHRDEMRFAEGERKRAEQQLVDANRKITEFRNAHRDFDPQAKAAQLESSVVGGLESQLAQYRIELSNALNFQGSDSPTVNALKSQIRALEQQISGERKRIGDSTSSLREGSQRLEVPYSELASTYSALTDNAQFARDAYLSAKQAFDVARGNVARRDQYVECFVKPSVPERPTSPNLVRSVLATSLMSFLLYVAGSLILSAFREQAGV
jgi:capsular polysaccharide transport system permease protein